MVSHGKPPLYIGVSKTLKDARDLLADCADVGYDLMQHNQQQVAAERMQAKDEKILRQARAEVKKCEKAFRDARTRLKYLENVQTTGRIYHGAKHYKFK